MAAASNRRRTRRTTRPSKGNQIGKRRSGPSGSRRNIASGSWRRPARRTTRSASTRTAGTCAPTGSSRRRAAGARAS
eukprot:6529542-Pyramimonas_sp.AAC.1